jgi:hypothetical protein
MRPHQRSTRKMKIHHSPRVGAAEDDNARAVSASI